jgi:hypothetical protein
LLSKLLKLLCALPLGLIRSQKTLPHLKLDLILGSTTPSSTASGPGDATSSQLFSNAQTATKKAKRVGPLLAVTTTSGLACALIDATESLLVSPSELMANDADEWPEAAEMNPAYSTGGATAGMSNQNEGTGVRVGCEEQQHHDGELPGSLDDNGEQLMSLLGGSVRKEAEEGADHPEEEDVDMTGAPESEGLKEVDDEPAASRRGPRSAAERRSSRPASGQQRQPSGDAFDLRQQLERCRSSATATGGSTSQQR